MKSILYFLIAGTMSHQALGAEILAIVNKGSTSVSFVNIGNGEVNEVKVGYLPHEIAVTDTHAYISNYGNQHVRSTSLKNKPGNSITVVNLSDYTIKEIVLGGGRCAPHGIEASRDNKFVYVTCEGRQEIAVINTQKGEVDRFLRTNQSGSHMLVSDIHQRLYVANFWIGTVSVIDVTSGRLLKQIKTGRTTEGIAISPDQQSLYVTVVEEHKILKISTEDFRIKSWTQLSDGTSPIRVQVSWDNNFIVVNHVGSNSVGIYDATSLELIKKIPVGRQPIGLALSSTTQRAYVANMKDNSISVISLPTLKRVGDIQLKTQSPDGLAVIK